MDVESLVRDNIEEEWRIRKTTDCCPKNDSRLWCNLEEMLEYRLRCTTGVRIEGLTVRCDETTNLPRTIDAQVVVGFIAIRFSGEVGKVFRFEIGRGVLLEEWA